MSKRSLLSLGVIAMMVGLALIFGRNIFIFQKSVGPRLQVTTSFYPLYFFTSEIVGDKATVYNITPSGAEPHDYDPSTQDIARIEDSQLLVLNGGKLEAWGDKIKSTLQGTNTQVITVGDDIANQMVVEDGNTIRDPHVWLDPKLAKKEVDQILKSLVLIDPVNAAYFTGNAESLKMKLGELDAKFRAGLANCQKKDIITTHAAFGYLAKDYGLNQLSISGLSPDEEPSVQTLANLVDFSKKNGIKYIFFESLVSPKLAETVASEVGASTLVLNPIEGLTDTEIGKGKNYFTEMEQNLTNLKIAFECR